GGVIHAAPSAGDPGWRETLRLSTASWQSVSSRLRPSLTVTCFCACAGMRNGRPRLVVWSVDTKDFLRRASNAGEGSEPVRPPQTAPGRLQASRTARYAPFQPNRSGPPRGRRAGYPRVLTGSRLVRLL